MNKTRRRKAKARARARRPSFRLREWIRQNNAALMSAARNGFVHIFGEPLPFARKFRKEPNP
jgi:hypothetical protein